MYVCNVMCIYLLMLYMCTNWIGDAIINSNDFKENELFYTTFTLKSIYYIIHITITPIENILVIICWLSQYIMDFLFVVVILFKSTLEQKFYVAIISQNLYTHYLTHEHISSPMHLSFGLEKWLFIVWSKKE